MRFFLNIIWIAYWPFAGPNQIAVRTDSYKLVDTFLKNDIDELYDLKADPGEMTNLIKTIPRYAEN